jgi:hypothetical protein
LAFRFRTSAAATATLLLVSPVGALARQHADPSLHGRAISRVEPHLRILAVHARGDEDGDVARGGVRFVHQSPEGVNRFVGAVSCLRRSQPGTVEISGSVVQGRTTTGDVLAGRDFAFTVHMAEEPQQFSLPRFGDGGTLAPCSGGRPEMVPVTAGGFRSEP